MPEEQIADHNKYAEIRGGSRYWAIAAIHGEAAKLERLHEQIAVKFRQGDRVIYLGDYLGHGPMINATVNEILRFRRLFLAQPPFQHTDDFVALRGRQEEMWRKLLQIQFAPDPMEVVDWVMPRGVQQTLEAYGATISEANAAARDGLVSLSRWTNRLKAMMSAAPGHANLFASLRRAAFTADGLLLFVNNGLNADRPLTAQSDSFWWDGTGFDHLQSSYGSFLRVIRGFDPEAKGIVETDFTLSIDGGCGRGGDLNAVCLDQEGRIVDQTSA